jgi:hypothetical protein
MSALSLVCLLLALCSLVTALFLLNRKLAMSVVWFIFFTISFFCIWCEIIDFIDFGVITMKIMFIVYSITCGFFPIVFEEKK